MNALFQNTEILFGSSLRVPKSERDDNLFYYEIRHDDECQGIPCELADFIFVNHLGTIATSKPLNIGKYGYILSDEEQFAVENVLYGKRAF